MNETPATGGLPAPGLPGRSWGLFISVIIAFFWTVRWYENADVRAANAASIDRYHIASSRTAIEGAIMDRLRPDLNKHSPVQAIERNFNNGNPLRREQPSSSNLRDEFLISLPDTALGLPARGVTAQLSFYQGRLLSAWVRFPKSLQLKQATFVPVWATSKQKVRDFCMNLFKVGLCVTAAVAIAAVCYVPRRRMLGQLALMCVILTVLSFGFASPIGPVKFMGAMAGAVILALLYAVKLRLLLQRMQ